jgi:hypothetical protein
MAPQARDPFRLGTAGEVETARDEDVEKLQKEYDALIKYRDRTSGKKHWSVKIVAARHAGDKAVRPPRKREMLMTIINKLNHLQKGKDLKIARIGSNRGHELTVNR